MRQVDSTGNRRIGGRYWLAIALAALLVLAACGDEDAEDTATDDEPDVEEPTQPDEPDEVEPEEAEAPDEGMPGAFEEGLSGPARVTYSADLEVEAEDTFTISYDPPRTAFLSGDMRIVDDGEGTTFFCEGAECQEMPSEQGFGMTQMFLGPFAMMHEELRDGMHAGVDVEESTTEIAGRQAVCITLSASQFVPDADAGNDSLESCVDEETGAALRWALHHEDGTSDVVEAVEFGEPREEDFATG